MKKTLRAILLCLTCILSLGILTACDQRAPEQPKKEYQIKNEKYIEELRENPEYQALSFELSNFSIYYKVLKGLPEGQEPVRPIQNSRVQFGYTLSLISGEKPENDQVMASWIYRQEGQSYPESVVRGMQLALQHMSVGERWQVVIPWQLGYGAYVNGAIPAYSTLIFEVELLNILEL